MKIRLVLLMISVAGTMIAIQSCSKGGSTGGGTTAPPAGKSLSISLDKTTLRADGWETVTITIRDQDNNDVTSSSSIFAGNIGLNGNTFFTGVPGTHKIKASRSGVNSPEVTLTATDPGQSPYTQKIIVEDFTGTWCGHCPRVGIPLENYHTAKPNAIIIANHGPSSDPYTFSNHAALASVFNTNGAYPTVIVDRDFKWNENTAQLDAQLTNRRPPLGLSFQTSVNGNTISGTARVKFDVNTAVNLKLVMYLLEDGKVYPQVNYNYHGLPNPISNYVHNGILRKTITDLYGDDIPAGNQIKGSTYEKNFTVDATGYNISKCRIVAFVVHGLNNQSRKERSVVNAAVVQAGANLDYN